jgi:hypothetical protein
MGTGNWLVLRVRTLNGARVTHLNWSAAPRRAFESKLVSLGRALAPVVPKILSSPLDYASGTEPLPRLELRLSRTNSHRETANRIHLAKGDMFGQNHSHVQQRELQREQLTNVRSHGARRDRAASRLCAMTGEYEWLIRLFLVPTDSNSGGCREAIQLAHALCH